MTVDSDAYEELTRTIVERLARLRGVSTVRLERDVVVPGLATHHQIDVVWQFRIPGEEPVHTVVFECRRYQDPIKKGRLLEFKGVVDDIAAYHGPGRLEEPHGTMVTYSRYQIGARRVAETYGLTVTELRPPTDADVAGRVLAVHVAMELRVPHVENLHVEPVQPQGATEVAGWSHELEIEYSDGVRTSLVDLLLAGELAGVDEPPTVSHRVRCTFDPPVGLVVAGRRVATLRRAEADVSETVSEVLVDVGGREHLAHVLLDALDGERVWFSDNGRAWSTDAPVRG